MSDEIRYWLNWIEIIDRNDLQHIERERVLVFSPEYAEGHEMRYRVMDGRFVRISTGATHYAFLNAPEGAENI